MGAVTKGQDMHPPTLDICGKIEIEKRKKYPKHEYQELEAGKLNILSGPIFFNMDKILETRMSVTRTQLTRIVRPWNIYMQNVPRG
jgi:hypothetical protein